MSSMNNDGDSPVVPMVKPDDVDDQTEVRPADAETGTQTEVVQPPARTVFSTLAATLTSFGVLGRALVVIVGMLLLASQFSAQISFGWFVTLEVVAVAAVYIFDWASRAKLPQAESCGYGFVMGVAISAIVQAVTVGPHLGFLLLLAAAAPGLLETLSFIWSCIKAPRSA